MDEKRTIGILVQGSGAASTETIAAVGDALVKVMDKAFETHMDQSVVNNAIDTLRKLSLSHSDGPTSVNGCNIRMGDDWYIEKDEIEEDGDDDDE